MHISENFEFASTTHIVTITGSPIGNYFLIILKSDLIWLEGLDHALLISLLFNPAVRFNTHSFNNNLVILGTENDKAIQTLNHLFCYFRLHP